MRAKATFVERTPAPGAANAAPAQPQILVPSQAVITRDGGPKVFEVVDGRAKALTVSTRATRQDHVIVTRGLGRTETLIVNPPADLADGAKVSVRHFAIARAIVTDPDVLVADEPTGDLDAKSAEDILNLMETLNREFTKTIVMVTHDPRASARAHVERHLEKGVLTASVSRHEAVVVAR